jgi:hypothetical protein
MFISHKFKTSIWSNNSYVWEYEIIDSEFGTVSDAININFNYGGAVELTVAVIQEYSKRKLNVAANLAVAFGWWKKQHPRLSIKEIIDQNKMQNSFFLPYEKDIQKYLLLL